jgi:NAD(P)-dependent dehydrogenase (short-subunit alcohol dehydrogenase family)
MHSNEQLRQRVILVMGGTTGIGAAVVRATLAEGAYVVAVGRDPSQAAPLNEQLGPGAERLHVLAGDATCPETAQQAVQWAMQTWHRLDGLVHIAGGSGRSLGDGPLHSVSTSGWQETLRWNLDSVFFSNRAALNVFLRQRSGCIVNMTSVLASHPSPRYFGTHAYAAAKAAIVGMTQAAAAYYAPFHIRVNAIAPGLVATPMAQRALHDEEIRSYIANKQPLKSGGVLDPEDIAGLVVFLLSDAACSITGQIIAVDAGWSVTDSGSVPNPDQTCQEPPTKPINDTRQNATPQNCAPQNSGLQNTLD